MNLSGQIFQTPDSLAKDTARADILTQQTVVRDTLAGRHSVSDSLSCTTQLKDSLPMASLPVAEAKAKDEVLHLMSVDSCLRASVYRGRFACTENVSAPARGREVETFSATYHRADFYTLVLLFGLVLVVGVWRRSYRYIKGQTLQFFFPSRQTSTSSQAEVAPPTPQRPLAVLLVGSLALLGFRWFDDNFDYLYVSPMQPYALYVALSFVTAIYLIGNLLLHAFVHGIFFAPAQRREWRDAYALVLCVEATLCFALLLAGFLLEMPVDVLFQVILGLILCSKVLLLYKAKCIFFCGLYGYFHVLLYLCTLEIAPLLIFGKILMNLLGQNDIVIH